MLVELVAASLQQRDEEQLQRSANNLNLNQLIFIYVAPNYNKSHREDLDRTL